MKRPVPGRSTIPVIACLVAASSSASAQVSGTVVQQGTLLPIEGALVTLQATTVSTGTDPGGAFDLADAIGSDLVIVAARKGFYNASVIVTSPAAGIQIVLQAIPQEDDPSYQFVAPNTCSACHDQQTAHWEGSPMALAGTSTWVYDLYDGSGTPGGAGGFVYTRDSRHASSNPNSECASCHQPEVWIADPLTELEDIGYLSDGALHGVSCEVCHKIAHIDETNLNFPGMWPGVVTVTRPSATSTQVQYGVLGDTSFILESSMRPSYQPQIVSEACAACHQDKNDPDGDGDFEEPNGVVSEPTFDEWDASPYADPQSSLYESCAECHMPSYGSTEVCNLVNLGRDPETIRHHRIEGTTASYLENAVTMALLVSHVGSNLEADVLITNDQTGHHVPTGTTIRNMILLVEAWREEDGMPLVSTGTQVVHELGGVGDPAQGYYAGLPGKLFAKVNHDSSGQGPTFFTEATGILFDNRIAALATDATSYTFDVPPEGGTLHIRARLVYRRAFRFLVDEKGWTEGAFGGPLEDIAPPYFGHLMEEEEWSAVVTEVGDFADVSRSTALFQNRPNPARASTSIHFRLPQAGRARITVFDPSGRLVATLANGFREAGHHTVDWHGLDDHHRPVASGVYLYRLEAVGQTTQSRRMVWLR